MPPTRRHNSRKKPLTEIPVNALKPAKPAKPSHPTIETSPTLPVPPVPPRATDILRADRNIQQYILQLEEHSEKLEEHIQQQLSSSRLSRRENSTLRTLMNSRSMPRLRTFRRLEKKTTTRKMFPLPNERTQKERRGEKLYQKRPRRRSLMIGYSRCCVRTV